MGKTSEKTTRIVLMGHTRRNKKFIEQCKFFGETGCVRNRNSWEILSEWEDENGHRWKEFVEAEEHMEELGEIWIFLGLKSDSATLGWTKNKLKN